jgi:hypothetical protein
MRKESEMRTPSPALGLAAAGLLLAAGGVLHPRVDTEVDFEAGLAGMVESSTWVAAHALTMAGFVLLAVSLAVLARGSVWAWAAAAGAAVAAVESVPHLLAADAHTLLQAVATPAVGLSIAALAIVRGGKAAAFAVVGGVAYAMAGPAIALTEDSAFSPLFVGSAGIAIWCVVAGTRMARTHEPAVAR